MSESADWSNLREEDMVLMTVEEFEEFELAAQDAGYTFGYEAGLAEGRERGFTGVCKRDYDAGYDAGVDAGIALGRLGS
ncbi:MAG: hypothetical protein ACRCZD_17770 [Phycicoccus sp.]